MQDEMEVIGNRLRNIRESLNMTRKDVEMKSQGEIKESILAMYESGRRRLPTPRLKKLADFYGVPVSYILGEKDNDRVDIEALLMSDPKYSQEEKDLLLHVLNIIKAKRRAEGKE